MSDRLLEMGKAHNHYIQFPSGFGDGEGEDESSKETQKEDSPAQEELSEEDPRVAKIVAGLKKKNSELLTAQKDLKNKLNVLEGLDPKEVSEALKNHRSQQERKMMDEGKIDELLERRTERMIKDHEAKQRAKDNKIAEQDKKIEELVRTLNKTVLTSAISSAAAVSGVRPQAVGFLQKLAEEMWRVEEGNKLRAYDSTGPIMGKDTKPISVQEWVSSLRGEHDYLFQDSFGGDAGGRGTSKAGSNSGSKLKRSEMTVAEKTAFIAEHGNEAFYRLPA